MQPFILNRTGERRTKSVGRIVLYALLFFIVSRFAVMLSMMGCNMVYMAETGSLPMKLLDFAGDPSVMAGMMGWKAVPYVLLVAPVFEECCFRLGLSFRRWHVALGVGALALFFFRQIGLGLDIPHVLWYAVAVGIVVAALIWLLTTNEFWESKREKWLRPMIWCSAILFALVHLFAMQGLTWFLLPFALVMCLMLFFASCAITYLRVNLGFWWGVGAHIVNNIPPAIMMAVMSMQ